MTMTSPNISVEPTGHPDSKGERPVGPTRTKVDALGRKPTLLGFNAREVDSPSSEVRRVNHQAATTGAQAELILELPSIIPFLELDEPTPQASSDLVASTDEPIDLGATLPFGVDAGKYLQKLDILRKGQGKVDSGGAATLSAGTELEAKTYGETDAVPETSSEPLVPAKPITSVRIGILRTMSHELLEYYVHKAVYNFYRRLESELAINPDKEKKLKALDEFAIEVKKVAEKELKNYEQHLKGRKISLKERITFSKKNAKWDFTEHSEDVVRQHYLKRFELLRNFTLSLVEDIHSCKAEALNILKSKVSGLREVLQLDIIHLINETINARTDILGSQSIEELRPLIEYLLPVFVKKNGRKIAKLKVFTAYTDTSSATLSSDEDIARSLIVACLEEYREFHRLNSVGEK